MIHPKISVIIPVYRTEEYIRRCLDSIINQTFIYFELLLIDDGSPDASGAICDEYASHDTRIHVYHKDNGGVSTARQLGIDKAQAEYIIHADPDDWVEPRWLELLYNKAVKSGADITICNYKRTNFITHEIIKVPQSTNNIECLKLLMENKITGQLWNKLVRRDLLIKHNIRITPGLDLREDSSIMYPIMFHANKVAFVNDPLYNYWMDNKYSYVNNLMKCSYQEDLYLLLHEMDTFKQKYITDKDVLYSFMYQKLVTLGYLLINGSNNFITKNKVLYRDIHLSNIKICPYKFYKPALILIILKMYFLIPVYRKLLKLYHK